VFVNHRCSPPFPPVLLRSNFLFHTFYWVRNDLFQPHNTVHVLQLLVLRPIFFMLRNCMTFFMFVDPCLIVQFIKKNPTRCNNITKFYYSVFIWSSTCSGRHTAHHQAPKTALAASGFLYVEGCWTCSWWTLSGTVCAWQRPPTTRQTTFHVWKTRGCQCSFRLLMMGGV